MNAIETFKTAAARYLVAEDNVREAPDTQTREEFAAALLAYRKAFIALPFEKAVAAFKEVTTPLDDLVGDYDPDARQSPWQTL